MFSDEVKNMLIEVISSWQVLAVTGVLVIYIFIVNSVARIYRRRSPKWPKEKAAAAQAAPVPAPAPTSETDELGLEEEAEEQ